MWKVLPLPEQFLCRVVLVACLRWQVSVRMAIVRTLSINSAIQWPFASTYSLIAVIGPE